MKGRVKDLYLLTMYALAIAGIIILTVTGVQAAIWVNLLYSLGWLLSFSIRNLVLYSSEDFRRWAHLTYLTELLLIAAWGVYSPDTGVNLLVYLTFADCLIIWGKGYGVTCYVLALLSRLLPALSSMTNITTTGILRSLLHELPLLTLVAVISYLIGTVLRNSLLLEQSMRKVQEREAKLQLAYQQLGDAYRSLEELSAWKERNRIARDIHDTVGHTLTTVIVELEAGQMLADKHPASAREKYTMAQEQAVKALNEMRRSVRMLREEPSRPRLGEAIQEVLEETARHTDIVIRSAVDLPEDMETPYDDLLIRALKEGLANGIRHGRATAFFFKLHLDDGALTFLLQDNGAGATAIVHGFGLDNMAKAVEQAGGEITFHTAPGEGFDIALSLPIKRGAAI